MKNYTFTYKISGRNIKGEEIKDGATYTMGFNARTLGSAERQLHAHYYRAVKIELLNVTSKPVVRIASVAARAMGQKPMR